jgi:hypothetical protein
MIPAKLAEVAAYSAVDPQPKAGAVPAPNRYVGHHHVVRAGGRIVRLACAANDLACGREKSPDACLPQGFHPPRIGQRRHLGSASPRNSARHSGRSSRRRRRSRNSSIVKDIIPRLASHEKAKSLAPRPVCEAATADEASDRSVGIAPCRKGMLAAVKSGRPAKPKNFARLYQHLHWHPSCATRWACIAVLCLSLPLYSAEKMGGGLSRRVIAGDHMAAHRTSRGSKALGVRAGCANAKQGVVGWGSAV